MNITSKQLLITLSVLLSTCQDVSAQNIQHNLNLHLLQQEKLVATSTVLLNNKEKLVPIKNLEQKMASVNLGFANTRVFDSLLNMYRFSLQEPEPRP
ncbi:MAG: hypothetical protein JWQ96_3338 [Segetibacter sp.]|nr:hypothetical protein [Segetibacter sp.]